MTTNNKLKKVGGHLASAIAGMHPFISQYEAYLQLIGVAEDNVSTGPMEWGRRLERAILDKYADSHKVDKEKQVWVEQPALTDDDNDRFGGTPDAIYNKAAELVVGVDAKNIRYKKNDWGDDGSECVPTYIYLQAQWYMGVVKTAQEWHIAVLFSGQDYHEYVVKRHEDIIGELRQRAHSFLANNVDKLTPPVVDASEGCTEHLFRMFGDHDETVREANEAESFVLREYIDLLNAATDIEQKVDTCKNRLREIIAGSKGITDGTVKATWTLQDGSVRLDSKTLKAELPDVFAKYSKQGDAARVLRVK